MMMEVCCVSQDQCQHPACNIVLYNSGTYGKLDKGYKDISVLFFITAYKSIII